MQDRLSASQPSSLRSPPSTEGSAAAAAASSLRPSSLSAAPRSYRPLLFGKEAKHRQVLRGAIAVQTDDDDDGEDEAPFSSLPSSPCPFFFPNLQIEAQRASFLVFSFLFSPPFPPSLCPSLPRNSQGRLSACVFWAATWPDARAASRPSLESAAPHRPAALRHGLARPDPARARVWTRFRCL